MFVLLIPDRGFGLRGVWPHKRVLIAEGTGRTGVLSSRGCGHIGVFDFRVVWPHIIGGLT